MPRDSRSGIRDKRKDKMKKLLVAAMILFSIGGHSLAAEKTPLSEIDTKAFARDTQVTFQGSGNKHVALAWWIPHEFWESISSRDMTTSEFNKKAMLDVMSGVSLLAVVQADVTSLGAFQFYSKEEIEKNMLVTFSDASGKTQTLSPMQTIDPGLEVVLGIFKPILGGAMGNLGNNMHFYVLKDKWESSPRLLDPYRKGQINIRLAKRDESLLMAGIEMPVNSLFVPRKCSNGKPAHISWNYCPWSGEKLGE